MEENTEFRAVSGTLCRARVDVLRGEHMYTVLVRSCKGFARRAAGEEGACVSSKVEDSNKGENSWETQRCDVHEGLLSWLGCAGGGSITRERKDLNRTGSAPARCEDRMTVYERKVPGCWWEIEAAPILRIENWLV